MTNHKPDTSMGFSHFHRIEEPTRLYVDDVDIVKRAAVDRAVQLFRYPEDQSWAVSLRSERHSYEVRKPVYAKHTEFDRLEVYRDGRRLATT